MCFENYILEAIERVLAWEVSDEALSRAVTNQAALMARISPDQIHGCCLD